MLGQIRFQHPVGIQHGYITVRRDGAAVCFAVSNDEPPLSRTEKVAGDRNDRLLFPRHRFYGRNVLKRIVRKRRPEAGEGSQINVRDMVGHDALVIFRLHRANRNAHAFASVIRAIAHSSVI